jgi:hypothetical protein
MLKMLLYKVKTYLIRYKKEVSSKLGNIPAK